MRRNKRSRRGESRDSDGGGDDNDDDSRSVSSGTSNSNNSAGGGRLNRTVSSSDPEQPSPSPFGKTRSEPPSAGGEAASEESVLQSISEYIADREKGIRKANLDILVQTLSRSVVPESKVPCDIEKDLLKCIRKDYEDTFDLAWKAAGVFSISVDDESRCSELFSLLSSRMWNPGHVPRVSESLTYALFHVQYAETISDFDGLEQLLERVQAHGSSEALEAALTVYAAALCKIEPRTLAEDAIRILVEAHVSPFLDHSKSVDVRIAAGKCLALVYEAYWARYGLRTKRGATETAARSKDDGIKRRGRPNTEKWTKDLGEDYQDHDADGRGDDGDDDEHVEENGKGREREGEREEDDEEDEEAVVARRLRKSGRHVNEELLEKLDDLASDNAKSKSKDAKKEQRRVFRLVLETVEGYAPADLDDQVYVFNVQVPMNSWRRQLLWALVSRFLADGVNVHLQQNPFLHSLFDLSRSDIAALATPSKLVRSKSDSKSAHLRDRRSAASFESSWDH
eukprot:ANDGO_08279.mRNA.1 hypothetical protein